MYLKEIECRYKHKSDNDFRGALLNYLSAILKATLIKSTDPTDRAL